MLSTKLFNFPSTSSQNPFATMNQLARQMDLLNSKMFERPELHWFSSKAFPAVNITEDKDKYYVRAELPGMKAEDINVEIVGKNLAISGERRIQSEGENARYHRRERESGAFSKMVVLPGDIDSQSVNAKTVDGVLTVEIAKSETAKPRKIKVN